MKKLHSAILISSILFMTACQSTEPVTPTTQISAAATKNWPAPTSRNGVKLQKQLAEIVEVLPPEDRLNVQIYDPELELAYDNKLGEIKIEVGHLNESGTAIVFKDGSSIKYIAPSTGLRAQALCEPYRQVRSISGFSGVSGTVKLPALGDVRGIDTSGEAAYNYFGIYTNGTVNQGGFTEAGLFRAKRQDPNTGVDYFNTNIWYAYENGVGYNLENGVQKTGFVPHRDFTFGTGTEGIASGTSVNIDYKAYAYQDSLGNLKYFMSSVFSVPGFSVSKTYVRYTPTINRSTVRAARTTSYLSNTHTADEGTYNNIWSGVTLKQFTLEEPRTGSGYYSSVAWNASTTAGGFPVNTDGKSQPDGTTTCNSTFYITAATTFGDYSQDHVSVYHIP